jgi:HNH endonuclease
VTTSEARFWSKVERRRGCWIWKARVDRGGYGIFSLSRRRLVRAHRQAWLMLRGRLPPSGCLLHRCGDRRCVNPAHLYVGSAHDSHIMRRPSGTSSRPGHAQARPRGRRHWTHRQPGKVRRGERSNLSKLRAAQVLRIRALHAQGVSVDELARRFRVVRETIGNIVHFRTWRDLDRRRSRA